jgi:hypothetical protein
MKKLRLPPNLVSLCFFLDSLQPITAVAGCTAIINILEPGAFYPEFQHFISIFNKISLLCK